jgi:hypothetical protein
VTADPSCPVCTEPLDGHGQPLANGRNLCGRCWVSAVTALRSRRPPQPPTTTTVATATGPTAPAGTTGGAAGPGTAPDPGGGRGTDGAEAEVVRRGSNAHSGSPQTPTLGAKR